jgi:hypothetical protein
MGSEHRMKKIKSIPTADRIVGGLNMRLRIHANGTEKRLQTVVVNLDALLKSGSQEGATENDPLKLLCAYISSNLSGTQSKKIAVNKLYNYDGSEITSIDEISHDLEIWISDGAPFKSMSVPFLAFQVRLFKIID